MNVCMCRNKTTKTAIQEPVSKIYTKHMDLFFFFWILWKKKRRLPFVFIFFFNTIKVLSCVCSTTCLIFFYVFFLPPSVTYLKKMLCMCNSWRLIFFFFYYRDLPILTHSYLKIILCMVKKEEKFWFCYKQFFLVFLMRVKCLMQFFVLFFFCLFFMHV